MAQASARSKGLHEEFARFFEEPKRETFRDLIRGHYGEMPHLDFKREWPAFPKVARHTLGFCNSGGGVMILGVAEKGGGLETVGLPAITDKAEVTGGMAKHVPERLARAVEILDFTFTESEYPALKGKAFQVLLVGDDPTHLPFVCKGDGDGIRKGAVYVRRGTTTEEASDEELQNVLNRRLETGYSTRSEIDLQTHLEQLRVLYSQIQRTRSLYPDLTRMMLSAGIGFGENPHYPKEDYDAFVGRLIRTKKTRIEIELGVRDLPDRSR